MGFKTESERIADKLAGRAEGEFYRDDEPILRARVRRLEGGLREALAYIAEERLFDTQFLAMLQGILDDKPE